jgi:hypothetical protein
MTPKGDLRTAAVFGGESARVLGKRNGTWRAEQKLTWSQWQAEGQDIESVLLKQGDHPFARDDWASTFVRCANHCAQKTFSRAADTSNTQMEVSSSSISVAKL